MHVYQSEYYSALQIGSRKSAEVIVPIVMEFVSPKSVADVGCGVGTWLSVFQEKGVTDIKGIDGDYVDRNMLLIPPECFIPCDLNKRFELGREFELVISLEVAEHLPAESAVSFVEFLTSLGPVVLFSAAIPRQGGEHHINEQWPMYWITKFSDQGYVPFDVIRPLVWDNPEVEYWYAQNVLLFVAQRCLNNYPRLLDIHQNHRITPLNLVHPRKYIEECQKSLELEDEIARSRWQLDDLQRRIRNREDPSSYSSGNAFRLFIKSIFYSIKR